MRKHHRDRARRPLSAATHKVLAPAGGSTTLGEALARQDLTADRDQIVNEVRVLWEERLIRMHPPPTAKPARTGGRRPSLTASDVGRHVEADHAA